MSLHAKLVCSCYSTFPVQTSSYSVSLERHELSYSFQRKSLTFKFSSFQSTAWFLICDLKYCCSLRNSFAFEGAVISLLSCRGIINHSHSIPDARVSQLQWQICAQRFKIHFISKAEWLVYYWAFIFGPWQGFGSPFSLCQSIEVLVPKGAGLCKTSPIKLKG